MAYRCVLAPSYECDGCEECKEYPEERKEKEARDEYLADYLVDEWLLARAEREIGEEE